MKIHAIEGQKIWDKLVLASHQAHPLQLWGWGELKRQNGWTPHRLVSGEESNAQAVAQMLMWSVPGVGWKLAYVPRGPLGSDTSLESIADYARSQGAFVLQVEPAWPENTIMPAGWERSLRPTLMDETFVLDLSASSDELLAGMARKTRQYIRKSAAEGVRVERDTTGQYLDAVLEVYHQTAARAGFGLQTDAYYRRLYAELAEHNAVFVALVNNKVEAFLWLATASDMAFELYGGVTAVGETTRANYTLKWSAITQMQAAGIIQYDFNGNLHDGVGRFKQSFGPTLTRYVGSWEKVLKPAQYHSFSKLWPLAKPLGRFFKRN